MLFTILRKNVNVEKKNSLVYLRMYSIWNNFPEQVQFSLVAQSCPTLCDPMDCSMPGFPVHHQLPELTQTHVHHVSDAIQPSHPLSSPSAPAFNLSQHQGLFKWVSSSHQVATVLEFQLQYQSFQWIFRTDNKESHKRKFYSRCSFHIFFFHWYQQMIQRWMRIISNFPILPKKQVLCFFCHLHFYIY